MIDFRRHRLRVQDSVNSITDNKSLGLGFDVNITGSGFNGFQQDFVDEPDDTGLLRIQPLQDIEVASNQCQKHLGNQIISGRLIQRNAAGLRRVVGDMNHQPQESIDEILPGTRSPIQAALQQN